MAGTGSRSERMQRTAMMATTEKNFLPTFRFLMAGLAVLGLAWFSPLTVDPQGHFFIARAAESSWTHLGDWAATWCSLKVILLGVGGFLLLMAAIELLVACERDALALMCGTLIVLPVFTFFLGCYYLIKALL